MQGVGQGRCKAECVFVIIVCLTGDKEFLQRENNWEHWPGGLEKIRLRRGVTSFRKL